MALRSDLIKFKRTDKVDPKLEALALEFADHFSVKREYLRDFGAMVRSSKNWKFEELDAKLSIWSERFIKKRESRNAIVALVKRAFKTCQNDNEISVLRGLLVESILIGVNGGPEILASKSLYGWGAKVSINREGHQPDEIYYYCTESQAIRRHACDNRATVDFGSWNGRHGKFYECKVTPDAIGCKEISYMNYLRQQLAAYSISHETFFVCLESNDSIKMRLEALDCSPLLKPFGIEELQSMIA